MRSLKSLKLRPLAVTINCSEPLRTIGSASAASKQDKEHELLERQVLNPVRAETCQSGTDDEVARHKSPYDSSKKTVESAVQALREEYQLEGDLHDPLLVSPANQQSSRILDPTAEEPVHGVQGQGSVKGWTNKNKKVLLRTAPYAFKVKGDTFFKHEKSQKKE